MARAVIAGAGLAGLACAVRLTKAGVPVVLLEAAPHAGGRCRSFKEKTLGVTIDNGNHLLLSGNTAAMALLEDLDARNRLTGPRDTRFPFIDLATGERWSVVPDKGLVPFWIFDRNRRVAGTKPGDYLSIARLMKRHRGRSFTEIVAPTGHLYQRFWDPFIVAVLNTLPDEAAAELVTPVLRETFAKGAQACQPLIARDGLSDAFIAPALRFISENGGEIRLGSRLADIASHNGRVTGLKCVQDELQIGRRDTVVLAVTAPVAQGLLPGLTAPQEHSAIVNLHYRLDRPAQLDGNFIGLVNGLAQWLFVREDIASVTISAANQVAERDSDDIARDVWNDIAGVLDRRGEPVPPCRVIKERRATFLQSPSQVALRPKTETSLENLLLAGDWTDTGLPATIEGAIRSGNQAAGVALRRMGRVR